MMSHNPNKNPLHKLTLCWDTINDTTEEIAKNDKTVNLSDLKKARFYLEEFINKNID